MAHIQQREGVVVAQVGELMLTKIRSGDNDVVVTQACLDDCLYLLAVFKNVPLDVIWQRGSLLL